jgi:ligand-binding sensor domain-containing protein/signal transduction histidine kinase
MRALAAGALSIILADKAFAIDPDRSLSQYVHNSWGSEQGFPRGPVYAITQTGDGYLWIGTESGLVRFDGWNFRNIDDPSGAFSITGVYGLAAGDANSLWVLLENQILLHYHDGRFERPSFNNGPYGNISTLSRSSSGNLLISKMEEGVFSVRGARVVKLTGADELPRSPVISLAETPQGDVWIGTRDAGLFRRSGGATRAVRKGLPDMKINCLLPEGEQDLLVGTDKGIVRWNGSDLVNVDVPGLPTQFQALTMIRDRDGNVWVGTNRAGLLRLNSSGATALAPASAAEERAISVVFEDREGDVWVGTADRIERLRDSAFVTYSNEEGLPTDGDIPLFLDSESRLWFPPLSGGLWWVQGRRHGTVPLDGLDRDLVYSMDGTKDELWLGRRSGGLTRLSLEGGRFSARTWTESQGLAQNSVYSVYRARDGSVWAGTLSAGVSVLRAGKFTHFTVGDGLPSNTVTSIIEASDGTMWLATPTGLAAFSGNRWRVYRDSDGLPSNNVNCLLEDSAGVLWVGTSAGIAFRKTGPGFHVPAQFTNALRSQIFGVAEDNFGAFWIATASHVLRVARDKLLKGSLSEADVRVYGFSDGLRGLEGVKRQRSVVSDPHGRIWFSLDRGISMVDPARLTKNAALSIPHIQGISVDGTAIDMVNAAHVPGGRRRVTFSYVGLGLATPEAVRYRCRLEGYDPGWIDEGVNREAGYTNLPPGHYTFVVAATNADGVWSPSEASISLQVDPLFWQTWWFSAAITATIISILVCLHLLRLRQMTRRIDVRFQERLAERTRIAQELHDTLLQGFLSASMQVHVAADRTPDESPAKPILTRALELMRQVIDEGRNAVRGLRSHQTALLDLEHAFSKIPLEFLSDQHLSEIDFRVVVAGERRLLKPLLRDEVYRLGREALVNAFRHAHAARIEMELKYSPSRFSMMVRDNGCGIHPSVLSTGKAGHWGLVGMRERAERIGARLHVRSSAAAGTEVELSVPGHLAFQNESRGRFRGNGKSNE